MPRYSAYLVLRGEYTKITTTKTRSLREASERMYDTIEKWLDERGLARPQAIAVMRGRHIEGLTIAAERPRGSQWSAKYENAVRQSGLMHLLEEQQQ